MKKIIISIILIFWASLASGQNFISPDQLTELISEKDTVIVEFWAPWGKKEETNIKLKNVYRLDISSYTPYAHNYNIPDIPFYVVWIDRKIIYKTSYSYKTSKKEELSKIIEKLNIN